MLLLHEAPTRFVNTTISTFLESSTFLKIFLASILTKFNVLYLFSSIDGPKKEVLLCSGLVVLWCLVLSNDVWKGVTVDLVRLF